MRPAIARPDGPVIAGLDGCRGGWYVARLEPETEDVQAFVCSSFAEAMQRLPPPTQVAVDIPIGLANIGRRACDEAARTMLAPTRSSSVFSAPIRPLIEARHHSEASALRRSIEGKGMTIQAFAIMAKVREVDAALRANPRDAMRVFEVHPEVSFAKLNSSRPLQFPKKRAQGRNERLELLRHRFGAIPERLIAQRPTKLVAADDVLDAMAALWTAERLLKGCAESAPSEPNYDSFGLRMAIHY